MKERSKPSQGDTKEITANILKSVTSAKQALDHLHKNLRDGGFPSALETYQTMTKTLVGQRLWAMNAGGNDELETAFRSLAEVARDVHRIMEPYVDQMRRLASLDEIGNAGSLGGAKSPSEKTLAEEHMRVLSIVKGSQRPVTLSRLSTALGLTTPTLNRVLKELERAGKIKFVESGTRKRVAMAGNDP